MTKEDLESKFEDCFDANTRSIEGGYGPDVTDRLGTWRAFDPIVAEFAKQQAIAFANYVMIDYKDSLKADSPILSDEEIYQQFIEQKIENK